MICPRARFFIDIGRCKMRNHLTTTTKRIISSIGIKLCEKFLGRRNTQSKHQSLVAVVTRPPVAFFESARHRHLSRFFSIAENTEFPFSRQDLAATQETNLTTQHTEFVIVQHFINVIFDFVRKGI